MIRRVLLLGMVPAFVMIAGSVAANDYYRRNVRVSAELKGVNETPAAVSTPGKGRFRATIDEANQTISYELSYRDLEGVPGQAHIHIGQSHTSGGVTLFLCGNAPTVPPAAFGTPPACPPSPAIIKGELSTANIIPIPAQGIAATDFDEIVELLKSGNTYANVHTNLYPAGEVRAQIREDKGRR